MKLQKLNQGVATLFMAVVGLLASASASAAYTVTSVTDEITLVIGAVAIIGAAVLVLLVAVKAWKWIGRAL